MTINESKTHFHLLLQDKFNNYKWKQNSLPFIVIIYPSEFDNGEVSLTMVNCRSVTTIVVTTVTAIDHCQTHFTSFYCQNK